MVPGSKLGMCLSMTLLIVDPWQYCVCCIRSGATRFILLMVLYLDRMCQCGLHTVLWAHIGSLASEPRSTAGPLFNSQCKSGTILLTLFSMVWDWQVSRAGPMFFIGLSFSIPTIFPFLFFLFLGWYCGAGVFGLIGCINYHSLSALHGRPFLIIIIR